MLPSWMKAGQGSLYDYSRSYKNLDPAEKLLIDNAADVKLLCEKSDGRSYEYDDSALLEYNGVYYVMNTSGCSCPDPCETWGLEFQGTKEETIAWFNKREFGRLRFHNAVAKLEGWEEVIPTEIPKGYDW